MKNKSGITLVEVMVVVGIIGIFAAIIIPNFLNRNNSNTITANTELSNINGIYYQFGNHRVIQFGLGDWSWGIHDPECPYCLKNKLEVSN